MVNIDNKTVVGFGEEWSSFDQSKLSERQLEISFNQYFSIFPWDEIGADSIGFDLGCGSGRWAKLVAQKVKTLHCIDASDAALNVAKRNLSKLSNCEFHCSSVDSLILSKDSFDFGYSLGVLHHIPDTFAGISVCTKLLKKGAPLLLYLYYRFDNRPFWFRLLWLVSDLGRKIISNLPFMLRKKVTNLLALVIYFPLARIALFGERSGFTVTNWPLSAYRKMTFYTMRTDALDRFGTRLEQRFTKDEIREMMVRAGLERIEFRESEPYWCAIGFRI